MKVVLLASDIAMPVFRKLVESKYEVVAVVCQPDKPNGRNNKVEFSEVKKYALSQNIKVLQYNKIRLEGVEDIKNLAPDFLLCAAYGQIISQELIDIPKYPTLNVHPSLLPKYRGPSPIITPILNGDKKTGVAIMEMVYDFDAGPIYALKEVEIKEEETAGELSERLFALGADMLLEVMDNVANGNAVKYEQNHDEATYCKMVKKEMAKLDFAKSCETLNQMVKAYNPTPVAYFDYEGNAFKVYKSEVATVGSLKYDNICAYLERNNFNNGEIVYSKSKPFGLVIKCENGFFMPKVIQAPGGKVMDIKSYLNGKSFEVGKII